MKNKIVIMLSFLLMCVITYYGHEWVVNTKNTESNLRNSRLKPIIFIPGSSASINRFDNLISKLNSAEPKHSILKVLVNADGSLKYSGSLNSKDLRPFIVIGFENNKDGYSNIKKQYQWLDTVMNDLQKKYHFKNFQAVGHSNGGLIWTGFLENGYDEDKFQISDFMSLGTPYNFSETSSSRPTVILKEYTENKNKLPKNLSVYSIAGTEDYTDDGIVPVQSVTAGKYIFQKQVKQFTQINVSGEEAQHSSLPENDEVISLIQEHLLKSFKSNEKNNVK